MRLLITCDPMLPVPPRLYGGIERIVADLVVGLREQGDVVGLVGHGDSTVICDAFFPWPTTGVTHVSHAASLVRACKQFEPDIVHSFSRLAYLLPLVLGGRQGVMSYQRHPTPSTVRWASRLGGERLHFTGCSGFIARIGESISGSWTAIPNFVDLRRLPFASTVPDDAPLLFLSRLDRVKGPHLAIEIARKAGRRLVIAGNHADHGPDLDYFRQHVEPHLGHDGVEYVGPVDDVAKASLLGQALGLLVPIQWDEPFGIVFAESLACGTPVISCNRGALPEIVAPGKTGFLVSSVGEGVRAVEQLRSISRAECRRSAEGRFSASVCVDEYRQLYSRILNGADA